MNVKLKLGAFAVTAALALGACGGSDDDDRAASLDPASTTPAQSSTPGNPDAVYQGSSSVGAAQQAIKNCKKKAKGKKAKKKCKKNPAP